MEQPWVSAILAHYERSVNASVLHVLEQEIDVTRGSLYSQIEGPTLRVRCVESFFVEGWTTEMSVTVDYHD